jgi:superfamily II DNA or RNA helicase
MEYFSSKRRLLLHSLDSSRKVVQTLLETIHKEPRNRVLIFSALTAQADKITEYTYHLKNKKQNNLELFEKGQFNTLGVCQAINRGANLTGVNVIIKESYLGSDTDFQQQHGRGVRLDPGQTMYFITLVPQYLIQEKKEINGKTRIEWIRRPTQASAWAGKMTEKFHYEPEIIDMVHDARNDTYKLPEGYDNLCQSY